MNNLHLVLLAFSGGVFLAVQGGFNSQLSNQLQNPILASLIAFAFSALFAGIIVLLYSRQAPSAEQIQHIPVYLWFSGAFFSVIGISMYYYTIPRLGISNMIALGLGGQLVFSTLAGHFGWFNLPQDPISTAKLFGLLAMITGIVLINK